VLYFTCKIVSAADEVLKLFQNYLATMNMLQNIRELHAFRDNKHNQIFNFSNQISSNRLQPRFGHRTALTSTLLLTLNLSK